MHRIMHDVIKYKTSSPWAHVVVTCSMRQVPCSFLVYTMHAQSLMQVCPQALATAVHLFFEALHCLGGLWLLILSIITNVPALEHMPKSAYKRLVQEA